MKNIKWEIARPGANPVYDMMASLDEKLHTHPAKPLAMIHLTGGNVFFALDHLYKKYWRL